MSYSLGNDAVCSGTITTDKLKYKTLDPPIGGFVNNPLGGDLDCNNNDLVNCNELVATTVRYTTLDPPLPTNGVFTPMVQDLDGGNFNIASVNDLSATSGTFSTSSALGAASCDSLSCSGNLSTTAGNDITCGSDFSATGAATIDGKITAKAGIELQNGFLNATGAGSVDLSNWNSTTTGKTTTGEFEATGDADMAKISMTGDLVQSGVKAMVTGSNGLTCQGDLRANGQSFFTSAQPAQFSGLVTQFNEVRHTGVGFGTYASPINLSLLSTYTFNLVAGRFVLDLVSTNIGGTITFEVTTTLTNVIEDYLIEAWSYCIDPKSLSPIPAAFNYVFVPATDTPGVGNFRPFISLNNVGDDTQVFRTRIKISQPTP